MQTVIERNGCTLTTDTAGGEAVSLIKGGIEYLWNADPVFWGRHAPVLFPFVGSLKNKEYRLDGRSYSMGQHGFARDMEFCLLERTDDSITYQLLSSEETLKKYPFEFDLRIKYDITDRGLKLTWRVTNTGDGYMPFSIGGHPAFMCPVNGQGSWSEYGIYFEKMGFAPSHLTVHTLSSEGLVNNETKEIELDKGRLTPSDQLFADDALIIEDRQADKVSLLGPSGKAYLTVVFDSPLLGIWSPVGKHAPFICIEPWFGRADGVDFDGELADRKYSQALKPAETFTGGFEVIF
ncbi:MAG: aldose 1-epimerase family protein [Lachnospiraceae bacterium]|nr:aldose 1-epimerase family protein [Lachnospiraceae bacterium]